MNTPTTSRSCWCGNTNLLPFSPEYGLCRVCGTLVTQQGLSDEQLRVTKDDEGFYGKQYWLGHQQHDLGFPDIHARARNDLTERNLHWLKTLLKYRLPPAKLVELGCSHGSFVALTRHAGYDSAGVEMSRWVVEFGQQTFGVPVSVGPIEGLQLAPASIDVIALMDVLEHLPDPAATIAHCLGLLKPDGLLLIQTPQFKEVMSYTELVKSNGAFLGMLVPDEHLYLFSERAVTRLFKELGAEHIRFERAIFDQYDMFFAVSRVPLQENTPAQIDSALLCDPNRRMVLSLLDLRERELKLTERLHESEVDRAARGTQIVTLTQMVKEIEGDRAARGTQIETLTAMVRKLQEP
jgi:2-polyprenyl-3-methyl-5-hydroxy-6-metoxy-1,4-benzoquinol methylase